MCRGNIQLIQCVSILFISFQKTRLETRLLNCWIKVLSSRGGIGTWLLNIFHICYFLKLSYVFSNLCLVFVRISSHPTMETDLAVRFSTVILQVLECVGGLTFFILSLILWISPYIFMLTWFSGKMSTSAKEEREIMKYVEQDRKNKKQRN